MKRTGGILFFASAAVLPAAFAALAITAAGEPPAAVARNVTPLEAMAIIDANKDNPAFILLDVRTPEQVKRAMDEAHPRETRG